MINVSDQLLKESRENQNYYVTAKATLFDGTKLDLKKEDFYLDGNEIVDAADSGDFPIGVAIEKTATLSLVNDEEQFSDYSFNKAVFEIYMNLEVSDGKVESFKRGSFIVCKKPAMDAEINLTLLDCMSKTDKDYDTNLIFPCTAGEMLRDSCQSCGIAVGDATFPNDDFQVMKKPTGTTHRAVIGMIAALAGGNARADENDLLRIVTYSKIDKDNFSGLQLFGVDDVETDIDEITVTGVKCTLDKQEYVYGQDGYMLNLKDNQLLSGNAQDGVNRIGRIFTGLTIFPFSLTAVPIGYATFGDAVQFEDYRGNVFYSYATDVGFSFADSTSFSCKAKSANDSVYPNGNKVLVEQAKAEVLENLSSYDVKRKQMNQLAANTLGFFYTEEPQPDGSLIAYRHDKPTLAESKIIYKNSIDGFFLSIDGGENWKAGFDSDGDAVLNILYAIGIRSEWIDTRGLTAKNNDGNITFRVDTDTGDVEIDPEHFRMGKTSLMEALEEMNKSIAAARNLTMQLSNDYQMIAVDAEGNYESFPSGITTSPKVMYGSGDVTAECVYAVKKSDGVSGNWDSSSRLYTVTGLNEDTGWIEIKATYLQVLTVTKRFSLAKLYAGEAGRNYYIELSTSILKRGQNGRVTPSTITGKAYYRDGKSAARTEYAGRWLIESSTDGVNYKTVVTSSSDKTSEGCMVSLLSKDVISLRVTLYAAGGTDVTLDMQTIPILVDVAALTHEQILDLLTNKGAIKGIYKEGDQLYISYTYAKGGTLTLGGENNGFGLLEILNAKGKKQVVADGGYITIYLDYTDEDNWIGVLIDPGSENVRIEKKTGGSIQTHSVPISVAYENNKLYFDIGCNDLGVVGYSTFANSSYFYKTLRVSEVASLMKSAKLYNLSNVTSGNPLVLGADGATIAYTSASSMRYKVIGKTVKEAELEDAYRIKVIWAKYKDEYLDETDERSGKEMPMFLAEDVDRRFPLAVDHNEKGKAENWNYRIIIPLMFAMIKNDHEKIQALENTVDALQRRLTVLEEKLKGVIS